MEWIKFLSHLTDIRHYTSPPLNPCGTANCETSRLLPAELTSLEKCRVNYDDESDDPGTDTSTGPDGVIPLSSDGGRWRRLRGKHRSKPRFVPSIMVQRWARATDRFFAVTSTSSASSFLSLIRQRRPTTTLQQQELDLLLLNAINERRAIRFTRLGTDLKLVEDQGGGIARNESTALSGPLETGFELLAVPKGEGGDDKSLMMSFRTTVSPQEVPLHADHLLFRRWRVALGRLMTISPQGGSLGNRTTLFYDGDDLFRSMLEEINRSNARVWLESYIFDGSKICDVFCDALIAAKGRGADVCLLVDWIGSFALAAPTIKRLRRHGVKVVIFNKPSSLLQLFNRRQIAFRDHRKLLITDSAAFVGSANIAADAGGPETGNQRFFDLHLKVEGPAVAHLGDVFLASLEHSNARENHRPIFPVPAAIPEEEGGGKYVFVMQSDRRRGLQQIQRSYEWLLRNAVFSISTTTSYFVPPRRLQRAIKNATQRGVNFNLFLSGCSDVWGDVLTTEYVMHKLTPKCRAYKLRVYRSLDRHLHAKALTADGLVSVVGSFNWDRLSFHRNLEVSVAILDPNLTAKIDAINETMMMDKECRKCLEEGGLTNDEISLHPRDHILVDPRLPYLPEITHVFNTGRPPLVAYLPYRLTKWAGGRALDQFVGPEREMAGRYAMLLAYSKNKGFLERLIDWLMD